MTIDFEKDQEQVLDKTTNINKLADKIKELQAQEKAVLNLILWVQQNMVS